MCADRSMKEPVNVVQALAQALALAGVRRMFGVPGGGSSLDLIEAAAALGIDFVLTKTENAAVMMAGAMAESSGVPGVAIMTKGPGLANGANGVAYASLDRAPVLVVTDGFTPGQLEYITHQVFDQEAVLAPLVKGHSRLDGADPRAEIGRLIALACTPPLGPVHVELTGEVARRLVAEPGPVGPGAFTARAEVGIAGGRDLDAIALERLERIRARIAVAHRPVVVLGLEARLHAPEVRRLVATLGCPVLVSYKAKGVVPDSDPQVVGLFTGGAQEQECIAQSDLMVLVGLDPVEMILQPWPYRKAVVEIAAAAHVVNYVLPETSVAGPLGAALVFLDQGLCDYRSDWSLDAMDRLRQKARAQLAYRKVERGVAPDRVVQLTAAACAQQGIAPRMSVDAGAHMFSATAFFPCARPGDSLISNGLATMSFALPAAIAASLDDRSQPVICFTGDGGLMMCLGELCTAVEVGARVVVIVFNDSALSLIDIKQQSRKLPSRGVRWQQHDFAGIMQALGGSGFKASDESGFMVAIQTALNGDRPCLIDVLVDPVGYPQQLKAMRG